MFHYLISYHYYARTDLDRLAEAAGAPDLTFLADSGAFSAHTAGAVVVLEQYAAWLKRWEHRIHAYANLDVLQDVDASVKNLNTMRAMGLRPLPVFHLGEPLSVFDDYLQEYDYIALGGMVRASLTMRDPKLWRYLADLHERAGAVGARLHGFGLSSWPVIQRFPWYSVDSSAPGSGYRYGRVMVYDPFANQWVTFGLRDRKAWHRHGWLVREYGMKPDDFKGSNTDVRGALITIAARSWSRAASTLSGKRFYLSDPDTSAMKGGPSHPQKFALIHEGNVYDTKVYVTDAALHQAERTHAGATRMRAYQDGNTWAGDTRLYITDPHPSANKNLERLAAWETGNRWGGEQDTPPPSEE